MIAVNCRKCAKKFYVKPNRIERGWGKYCSNKCKYISQSTGQIVECDSCKKPTYKISGEIKRSKSGKFFCSKTCQTIWRNSVVFIGNNHSNWKHGESAYRSILLRARTEQLCAICGSTDTRTLSVHHMDKNRQNNNISNLLWLCQNCHFLVHHYTTESRGFIV